MIPTKPSIIVLMGYSNAGKDTIYAALNRHNTHFIKVSFSSFIKRFLEETFYLTPYSLDTPKGKAQTMPYTNQTYLEFLIDAYNNPGHYKSLWLALAQRQIEFLLAQGISPTITDLRSYEELTLVSGFYRNHNHPLYAFDVISHKCNPQSSDIKYVPIVGLLHSLLGDMPRIFNDHKTDPKDLAQIVLSYIKENPRP